MLPTVGSLLPEPDDRLAQDATRRLINGIDPDGETNDVVIGLRSWPFASAKIFSVSNHLKEVRPASYYPFILVMGPFHRDRDSPEMKKLKSFSEEKNKTLFDEIHEYIGSNITRFMGMYDKTLECQKSTLIRELALDALLLSDILLEYASRNYPLQTERYEDYVLPRRHFWTVLRDLMLVENQIPFEILKKAMVQKEPSRNFEKDMTALLKHIYPFRKRAQGNAGAQEFTTPDFNGCHHLLELFYRSCTFKGGQPDDKAERSDIQIPTATQLRAAGIHIRGVEGDLRSIAFHESKRTLQMPMIKMYSETETWFRNLMAYEQCREMLAYEGCKEVLSVHWCSYMRLMGCLIDTAEDVKLLTNKKVLVNLVGSNEGVANVWNSLGMKLELFLTKRDWEVMDGINKHCACKRKIWWAEWYSRYCSRPWTVLSVIGAFIFLGLTIVQTAFTI